MENTNQHHAKAQLRKAVESTVGRKMQSHKDFTHLADDVLKKLSQYISPTTLKRFWGYLSEPVEPREETLDILSRYVGFDDWKTFAENAAHEPEIPAVEVVPPPPHDEAQDPPKNERQAPRRWPWIVLALLLAVSAVFALKTIGSHNSSIENSFDEHHILRKGQVFDTYDDYLRLFGITDAKDLPYHQIHPHHPFITIWGPHYHHPDWLNDGDSAQLLPTITERWAPTDASPELINLRNFDFHNTRLRFNEIRLTFMKNLKDTNFVFLGAYRMSRTLSDTTKTVWERVADEVDLRRLDYLQELRHP